MFTEQLTPLYTVYRDILVKLTKFCALPILLEYPYNWLVLVTKAKIRTIHGHKLDTDHLRFVKVSSLSPLSTLAILIATGGKDLGSENVQVCFCQFW